MTSLYNELCTSAVKVTTLFSLLCNLVFHIYIIKYYDVHVFKCELPTTNT